MKGGEEVEFDRVKASIASMIAMEILDWDIDSGLLSNEEGFPVLCGNKLLMPFNDYSSKLRIRKGKGGYDLFMPESNKKHAKFLTDKVMTEPGVSDVISFKDSETGKYHAKILGGHSEDPEEILDEVMLESDPEGFDSEAEAYCNVIKKFYGY
jgi:hypothetical protein